MKSRKKSVQSGLKKKNTRNFSDDVFIYPGSCNLGKAEIRRRQVVALIGAVLTLVSFAGLVAADTDNSARWSLFAPLMVFSIGFIQSRKKFCLAYGLMGTFNLGKLG